MGPGPLIAIDVILIYTLFGPIVLFGIYVLFDLLIKRESGRIVDQAFLLKDPALWTNFELISFL